VVTPLFPIMRSSCVITMTFFSPALELVDFLLFLQAKAISPNGYSGLAPSPGNGWAGPFFGSGRFPFPHLGCSFCQRLSVLRAESFGLPRRRETHALRECFHFRETDSCLVSRQGPLREATAVRAARKCRVFLIGFFKNSAGTVGCHDAVVSGKTVPSGQTFPEVWAPPPREVHSDSCGRKCGFRGACLKRPRAALFRTIRDYRS